MKRSTWEGSTVVYRYGCPSWAELPEAAMTQLRLGHNLRNELVAVEYRFREMVAAIWNCHPEVAIAQADVDAATEGVEAATAEALEERKQSRSTAPSALAKARLAEARRFRRDARAALKAAKVAVKDEQGAMLGEATRARYEAIKTCRGEAVECGLYWSTANVVTQNHDTAAKQIAEAWKQGRPAQRRFKRWDGSGTLSTQVMWQAGKPRRTAELLASSEGPWRNVVQLKPWMHPDVWPKGRGPHRHGTLQLRIATGAEPITLPVLIHRPIPADADITDVQVTRSRIAGQYRLSVAVTIRIPAPEEKTTGDVVAVRIGWKSMGDGWLRVATVSTPTGPLLSPPPADVAELIRVSDGCTEVFTHAAWRMLLDRDDDIRSIRDQNLDEIKALVVDALSNANAEASYLRGGAGLAPVERDAARVRLSECVDADAGEVSRWRSPRRFAQLARRWPEDHPLAPKLEAWRLRDCHLWEYESHERQQVIARRRDAWRKVAAWICEQASMVVVSGVDIAEVRQRPDVGTEDPHADRHVRRNGQVAAPGELRALIEQAAKRRGVQVIKVKDETQETVEAA